jgi:hypothetical protein
MAEQQHDLIVAHVRDLPLVVADCSVIKPPGPNAAMQQVLKRAAGITDVFDETSQRKASTIAQELQGLRSGLQANYKNAKQPVTSLGRALDNTFKELDRPMEIEYRRIDQLVSRYQDDLRRKAELAKARAEAEQRARERQEREHLAALERTQQEAALRARLAEDAREKAEATQLAKTLAPAIEEQKIIIELQGENLPVPMDEPPPKPPGGRVWTQYVVEMTDPLAVAFEHPELVNITLKQAAAQEFAKALDEAGKPLVAKGLKIQKHTRTSFTGAAAIRIDKD